MTTGQLDEARVRDVVRGIAQVKPRNHIAILSRFHKLVALELSKTMARVETATPLAPDQQQLLDARLRAQFGQRISLTFHTEPALVGGMRIRLGSDVWDGSVNGRLDRLSESFT
jgi:F-type H+-transporting ATPase subunit delta